MFGRALFFLLAAIDCMLRCRANPAMAQTSDGLLYVVGKPTAERAAFEGTTAAGVFQFQSPGRKQTVTADQLVVWGGARDAALPRLALLGGGVIVADLIALDGAADSGERDAGSRETLLADSRLFGEVRLPLKMLAGAMLRPPADAGKRDALLSKIQTASGAFDRLILENGDEVSGALTGLRNDPALGSLLLFESDERKLELPLARVAALIFNPSLAKPLAAKPSSLVIASKDGDCFGVEKFQTRDGQTMLQLPGGVQLRGKLSDIVGLQSFSDSAIYLSDLTPVSYKHLPFLSVHWPLGVDRTTGGRRLRAGGALYLKGLGMHSAARVTYDLPANAKRFAAELALDDQAAESLAGSVSFRVFVDPGSGRWETKFESPVVRQNDLPLAIDVPIAGAKRISLLVDYAERGDVGDYADWLNARVVK